MNSADDFWYRALFKLRVRGAFGDAFQLLVSDLWSYTDPDFQPISPWGSWGDGGNDGWIPQKGHYLQLYGPRATSPSDPMGALRKALGDFEKLPAKWRDVRQFTFVMNDHFAGIPAPIASGLQTLERERKVGAARAMGAGRLEAMFMDLAEDQRQLIVGGVPQTKISFFDSTAVGELLSGLADRSSGAPTLIHDANAPDFGEKVNFNGLSESIGLYLKIYSYQAHIVDEFLVPRDQGLKQAIAIEIQKLYQRSKVEVPDSIENAPSVRYVWLTEQLIPQLARKHPHTFKAYREAAQIVLAKYFESCDVYEPPN